MDPMSSLPSFELGVARDTDISPEPGGEPSVVGRACAEVLTALARFSAIVEADTTGPASQGEREALTELSRRIKTVRHQRCQSLDDYNAKCLTYEALKEWFPPHDPRMQLLASDLIHEFCQYFEQIKRVDAQGMCLGVTSPQQTPAS